MMSDRFKKMMKYYTRFQQCQRYEYEFSKYYLKIVGKKGEYFGEEIDYQKRHQDLKEMNKS